MASLQNALARAPSLIDAQASMSGVADETTMALVIMESLMLARAPNQHASARRVWYSVAAESMIAWSGAPTPITVSLGRQILECAAYIGINPEVRP